MSSVGRKVSLEKLKDLDLSAVRVRRRFDYEGIKARLIELGQQGIGLTFGDLEKIMRQFDSDPSKPVYGNQVRSLIKRMVADEKVIVKTVDDLRPTIYVFLPAPESE